MDNFIVIRRESGMETASLPSNYMYMYGCPVVIHVQYHQCKLQFEMFYSRPYFFLTLAIIYLRGIWVESSNLTVGDNAPKSILKLLSSVDQHT